MDWNIELPVPSLSYRTRFALHPMAIPFVYKLILKENFGLDCRSIPDIHPSQVGAFSIAVNRYTAVVAHFPPPQKKNITNQTRPSPRRRKRQKLHRGCPSGVSPSMLLYAKEYTHHRAYRKETG